MRLLLHQPAGFAQRARETQHEGVRIQAVSQRVGDQRVILDEQNANRRSSVSVIAQVGTPV
jgi:hypothetical protein